MLKRSHSLFVQSKKYIAGGVNSPVRSFKGVGGTPIFIRKSKGAYIYDEDRNRYIDYVNSWGAVILGHSHKKITTVVKKKLNSGISFGTPTFAETQICKLIVESYNSIDKVRLTSSGTEACMSAIRLARGFSGKKMIIKFAGCYHGHFDGFLVQAGSGNATLGVPNSKGVLESYTKETLIARFNDINSVKEIIKSNKNNIACLILEPVAGNMGCIIPKNNFLKDLRELCSQEKIILIFDEVMTGFRLSSSGAQGLFNVNADLTTLGKVIGGGMPIGAFGGRRDIMDFISPDGPVYQAGTLSGNPISVTCGYETLKLLLRDKTIYDQLEKKSKYLCSRIAKLFNEKKLDYRINQIGSMLSLHFSKDDVVDFRSANNSNTKLFNKFFHSMLKKGIYIPPSPFESWFLNDKLSFNDLDTTVERIKESLEEISL